MIQGPPEDGKRLCVTADASEKCPTLSIRALMPLQIKIFA